MSQYDTSAKGCGTNSDSPGTHRCYPNCIILTHKAGGLWGKQKQRKVEGVMGEEEEKHVVEKF